MEKTQQSLSNKNLKNKYNDIYKEGAYQNFFTFNQFDVYQIIIGYLDDWTGLDVLDLGCGEGDLSAMMAFAGARNVHAIDYSEEAIRLAEKKLNIDNINFELVDGRDVKGNYDVIVMAGVLEHIDKPYELLEKLIQKNLKKNGCIISACPSFMNPRGYIWMTLQMLLDVPMSLSDIHFFSPTDFKKYAIDNVMTVETTTISHDWGGGQKTILDFKKRLVNALRDANLNNQKVEPFLEWLKDALQYFDHNELSGANMITKFQKLQ
jgi:2-polyprenyl-3-methyl-5-hydroxy-6-metoxy-1,4-benzoquinol methylase